MIIQLLRYTGILLFFRVLFRIWPFLLGLVVLGAGGVVGGLYYLGRDLPEIARLDNPEYNLPTRLYDRHGQLIAEIFTERRKLIGHAQLPDYFVKGLVAKEDSRFFDHFGIDPLRILKAALVNARAGRIVQGASTLTQQTARQFFLSPEKKYIRKIKEILLALRIERNYSKEEILELYLNKVNFGDAYGVSAAAEYYFGRKVEELSLAQSATLIGLLPSPNEYKPTRNPVKATKQRNIVLARMADEGYITRTQYLAAASQPMVIAERSDPKGAATASYVELIRRKIQERFGNKRLYEGGLRVYTSMDLSYQVHAHAALVKGVGELDRRRGFRGPVAKYKLNRKGQLLNEEGKVDDTILVELNPGRKLKVGKRLMGLVLQVNYEKARVALGPDLEGEIVWNLIKDRWPNRLITDEFEEPYSKPIRDLRQILSPGFKIQVEVTAIDRISKKISLDLFQDPEANGSIFVMEPNTGEVLAMVGGIQYGRKDGGSEFIRATQAERQPGSSFKPIIYAAALEEGYTPASILDDSPRVFALDSGKKHIPKNYDNSYMGRLSLRQSLVRSRNVPTVQLVHEMGAGTVIKYARRFGITTNIPLETIIALGTHSVKLSELTRAYAVFPNGGKRVEMIYITRVENAKGKVLLRNKPVAEQIISKASAYMVADILRDVVRLPSGTGYRAMEGLGRPAGGKTGTTQNNTDAWYLGFIPQLVAGVYVGFDDSTISLGPSETGGKAAAPIWKDFIIRVEGSLPIETFNRPGSVVTMRVGPGGKLLDPCDDPTGSRFELFRQDLIPKRFESDKNCGATPLTRPSAEVALPEEEPEPGEPEDL